MTISSAMQIDSEFSVAQKDFIGAGARGALLRIVADDADSESGYEVLSTPARSRESFFSSDELLLPRTVSTYRKPVAAIHAIPERRDAALKLSARKLMEALPLAVQLDLRARHSAESQELVRKIREDRATPLFEIRTKELARLAGVSVSNMERIHETLADLVGYTFKWNVLGEDGIAEYEVVAPFLIRRDKGLPNSPKAGFTRFAFEPEILLWFLEPQMWATFSLEVMRSLGATLSGTGQDAAFGLYQNAWRYIGTAAKVTAARDLADWIDLIIGPSRFVQVDASGKKTVSDYRDFKRRFLNPGMEMLNSHPALNHTISLKEITSGRRVVKLQFSFKEKKQNVSEVPLAWPAETVKQLEELGYSEKDIGNLSQLHSIDLVAEALKRLPVAVQRVQASGSKVYSRKAFFVGILTNVAKGDAENTEAELKLIRAAEQRQMQEEEARRMEALNVKFKAHQRQLILLAIQALPDEQRDSLFKEHLAADPGARPLFKVSNPGAGYMAAFVQWILAERPAMRDAWLPEPKDRNFQSWLAWRLMMTD